MKAVLKAILLDTEARSSANLGSSGAALQFGKVREPVLKLSAVLRAFAATSDRGVPGGVTDDPATSLSQTPMRSPSVFNSIVRVMRRRVPHRAPPAWSRRTADHARDLDGRLRELHARRGHLCRRGRAWPGWQGQPARHQMDYTPRWLRPTSRRSWSSWSTSVCCMGR